MWGFNSYNLKTGSGIGTWVLSWISPEVLSKLKDRTPDFELECGTLVPAQGLQLAGDGASAPCSWGTDFAT